MPAIARLKISILKTLSAFTRFRCKLKGMTFGKDCFIDGMPNLRLARGAKAVLGDHVTLLSNARHNPLIQKSMHIQLPIAGALLEIASNAGISGSHIVCYNHISIGEYTIIGPDTLIFDWKAHDYDSEIGWKGRVALRGQPISIGRKCYIGTRCTIMKGVTIGDHCVVNAGTVVDGDVPSGHIAFGNPMQISPLPEKYTH